MNKHVILAGALALCLTLSACGDKAPKQEEVEAAIRDGSLTVEDALDKGWIDQAWVDSYMEENSVPAADKMAVNRVGEFETQTAAGETFTNEDMADVAFVAFVDPEDEGAADFCQALTDGTEGVRAAGADILVCAKGDVNAELFSDVPFPVVSYNDSMQEALARNDEMASGIPCTGVWYVDGSLISAWITSLSAEELADSAASFAAMGQESETDGGIVAMG